MAILFIDLTDGKGVGRNALQALQSRYGQNQIIHMTLVDKAKYFLENHNLGQNMSELLPLSSPPINSVNEIIIGAHGAIDNIEYCYPEEAFGEIGIGDPLMPAEELAQFCNAVLRNLQVPIGLELSMVLAVCYGARTSEYRENHISNSQVLDFRETFAYRFSRELTNLLIDNEKIVIHAYTGAVTFGAPEMSTGNATVDTGHIMVETEERIALEDRLNQVRSRAGYLSYIVGCFQNVSSIACDSCEGYYDRLVSEQDAIEGMPKVRDYGHVLYNVTHNRVEFDISRLVNSTAPSPDYSITF